MRVPPKLVRNILVCLALLGFLAKPLVVLAHDFRSMHAVSDLSNPLQNHSGSRILSKSSPADQRMRVLEREKDPSDLLELQVAQAGHRPLPNRGFLAPSGSSGFSTRNFLVLRI